MNCPDIKIMVCPELPKNTLVMCVPSDIFQIDDLIQISDCSALISVGWDPKKMVVLKGVDAKVP